MAIPDYQTTMLPLLRFAGDNQEHRFRDAVQTLADEFDLTEKERKELLPSGQQAIFNNRVGWARLYLVKAGLLEATRRGYFKITEQGHKALTQKPERIDKKFLMQIPDFVKAWESIKGKRKPEKAESVPSETTPEESLESAYQELHDGLASELLQTVKQCPPEFFERLVVDVLIKMGYGGSRKEAGQAVGKTSDGGIDGIIKEDKLGLDIIYIQAKRWEGTVGRPDVQKFAGALQGQRARKGIFITTSNFTKDALNYVENIETKIILIDGQRLAELMIAYNVGANTTAIYEVKKMDSDYFIDE
ncbi:MAG: restriction endonuclease [Desulfobacterales bacterium]|uniref:Restriction endonuclease n=1 Tax=Candidatus Desulfatibia vada TaxID=2841696 RepID=A0A8J6NRX3_9BACT|nr:restriction endonuclease [Candidatus Desulfatibia vada]